MRKQLIISDLDGTLLDSSQKISMKNQNAIYDFKRKGGLFTFATGRIEPAVKPYVEQLKINLPVILYNGAKIVCPVTQKVLYERSFQIHFNFYEKLIELADEQVSVLFYQNSGIYTDVKNLVTEAYERKESVRVQTRNGIYEERVNKILIIANRKKLKQYESFILASPLDCTIVYSENNYLEILPKGVSKGVAVNKLKRIMNDPFIQIICIGDNLNDYTMMKVADKGIAVENAHPVLKEAAAEVTVNHENSAIAKVISTLTREHNVQ